MPSIKKRLATALRRLAAMEQDTADARDFVRLLQAVTGPATGLAEVNRLLCVIGRNVAAIEDRRTCTIAGLRKAIDEAAAAEVAP